MTRAEGRANTRADSDVLDGAGLVRRIAAELAGLSGDLLAAEHRLGLRADPAGQTRAMRDAAPLVDRAVQRLGRLSDCLDALAADLPGGLTVDAARTIDPLVPPAMAARLRGGQDGVQGSTQGGTPGH